MKKITAVLLALIFALSALSAFSVVSFAKTDSDSTLRFNSDGKFRIMQVADMQDDLFTNGFMLDKLAEAIEESKPDLIVLTGDNISGGSTLIMPIKSLAIGNYMRVFEKAGVPVAAVFGNHDSEAFGTKEQMMKAYQRYDCFIGCEGEDLTGCGNYNLPIMSRDGTKVAFNLWMFDSLTYNSEPEFGTSDTYLENDLGGYACVHKDQIEWYSKTAAALKEANGGKPVPAFAFQHIIVPEIFDALVKSDAEGNVGGYVLPEDASGTFIEYPCPPKYSNGQFDAFLEQGDVVALFVGHDHDNSYTIPYKGINLVNTPGAGFQSYGETERGVRIIDIYENDPENYTDYLITWLTDDPVDQYRFILGGNEFSTAEKFEAFKGLVLCFFNRLFGIVPLA